MKKKKTIIALLPLMGALLLLLSLPKATIEKIRGAFVAVMAPAWQKLLPLKAAPLDAATIAQLHLENQLLKNENLRVNSLISELQSSLTTLQRKLMLTPQDQRQNPHYAELKKLHELYLAAIPANVIYRAPSTWNSSLWVNIGTSTNKTLGHIIIKENSPVLQGINLVGLVDFVGEKQSRVRLITDVSVTPAVRVLRNDGADHRLLKSVDHLQQALLQHDAFQGSSQEEKNAALQLLKTLQNRLASKATAPLYLAKGELNGSEAPLWKGQSHILKGIGFNYDFADEKGPARDLRFGTPYGSKKGCLALLKEGDLLVTSGMDGVFPPGLHVAEITTVHPLQEGDYYYTLEAKPTADNLDDLTLLFIIAPLGYDSEEVPSTL